MELISCGDRAAAWMPLVRGFVRGFCANIEESTYRDLYAVFGHRVMKVGPSQNFGDPG